MAGQDHESRREGNIRGDPRLDVRLGGIARQGPDRDVLGDFEVKRLLGRGGMGQVYLARQISLDRPVAIKVLHPRFLSKPAYLSRFEAEATAVAKLNHPNIVHVTRWDASTRSVSSRCRHPRPDPARRRDDRGDHRRRRRVPPLHPGGDRVVVFFIVYQQVENHLLQPLVYGRTVQLSPLAVLISVLIGAELAGVLGALAAIPVAGSLQVIFLDWLRHAAASCRCADPRVRLVRGMWRVARAGRPIPHPWRRTCGRRPARSRSQPSASGGRRRLRVRPSVRPAAGLPCARAGRARRPQRVPEAARPAPRCASRLGCPPPRASTRPRWPRAAISAMTPRTGRRSTTGSPAITPLVGTATGPSARTSSGRPRRGSSRRTRACGGTAPSTEEHAHRTLARDRPLRSARSDRARHVQRPRGHHRDH